MCSHLVGSGESCGTAPPGLRAVDETVSGWEIETQGPCKECAPVYLLTWAFPGDKQVGSHWSEF